MAANMQHMAGAAGMMQQQRPRPSQVQLNQFLYQTMLAQQQPHSGWQAGVAIQERMIKCHNLYATSRSSRLVFSHLRRDTDMMRFPGSQILASLSRPSIL